MYRCGALVNIASRKHVAERLVSKPVGLGIVTNAMKESPDNLALNKWGCMLFNRISQWDEFKKPIINSGAVMVLLTVIEVRKQHS